MQCTVVQLDIHCPESCSSLTCSNVEILSRLQVQDDQRPGRQGMVVLLPELEGILHPLQHWTSTAPEIKLISAPAITMVQQLCDKGKIPSGCNKVLVEHAPGVAKLLQYDARQHPEDAKQGRISRDLRALLTMSLGLSRAALKGASDCVTTPFEQPKMTKFEVMVRSATWTSEDHPNIRQLQGFRLDHDNERSRKNSASASASTGGKKKAASLQRSKEQLDEAHDKAEKLGACTKFKTSHRALTPGIFLSFCGRCYICEVGESSQSFHCTSLPVSHWHCSLVPTPCPMA